MTTWTKADAAELDVLVHELAGCYFDHVPTCDLCQAWRAKQAGSMPCPYVASAIEIVIDWRAKRQLLTAAEELRLQRNGEVERMAS